MKKIIIVLFLLAVMITLTSCKKKKGCTDPLATNYSSSAKEDDGSCGYPSPLSVGQSYQGGKIGDILQAGDPGFIKSVQHGLIVSDSDQSTNTKWDNGNWVITDAKGTAIGTGNSNTNAIVGIQGAGSYAAHICSDLVLGGFSDWYLPSRDELSKLWINRTAIGGFSKDLYWTSSEFDVSSAWIHDFDLGNQFTYTKGAGSHLRAVRSF